MERNQVSGILVKTPWHDDELCTVTRANVNKLIRTYAPLYYAIIMQSAAHVKALLEMGADPNNSHGHPTAALEYAVMSEGNEAAQITCLLLEYGAQRDDAVLGDAIMYQNFEQAWILVDHGHCISTRFIDAELLNVSPVKRVNDMIITRDACRESARATCTLGRRARGLRGNVDLWRLVARHVWSMRRHCSDE